MKALLVLLVACSLASCTLIDRLSPTKREAARRAQVLRDLNLRVMRFADEYAGRVNEVVNEFQAGTSAPEQRLSAQNWKTQQVESAYTIASGPNPVSNALDMVVLVSLSRLVLEDAWVGRQYGDRARPAQETYRILEEGAWHLVEDILTDSQAAQLRESIVRWRAENPKISAVGYIHFPAFAKSIDSGTSAAGSSASLFSLLGLDPLAQLDPAVQELTQTRAVAERAIFYMQRAPALIDMQLQRILYQFAVAPETKALLQDFDQAALVGTAAEQLAASLPDLITREREALLSQLMSEVDARQGRLTSLSSDVRATLQAGTETANSLQGALESFDRAAARFPTKDEPSSASATSEPFDITEYTEMLRELNGTLRELDTLAQHADAAVPALRSTLASATHGFERILKLAFVQLLVLVVVTIATTWAGAIAYRAAVFHMQRSASRAGQ